MGQKKHPMKREARLRRRLTRLWERGQSEYCEVRGSTIHGRGVYAAKPIPAGTRVIEYIGELVDKKESDRRAWAQIEKPGIYRGQCAELCGKDHGFMPIVVEALPKAKPRWCRVCAFHDYLAYHPGRTAMEDCCEFAADIDRA